MQDNAILNKKLIKCTSKTCFSVAFDVILRLKGKRIEDNEE